MNPWLFQDPLNIGVSFAKAGLSWLNRYPEYFVGLIELYQKWQTTGNEIIDQYFSKNNSLKNSADDESGWVELTHLMSICAHKYHEVLSRYAKDMVELSHGFDQEERKRLLFWTTQIIHASSPSNFILTNPGAIRRLLKSKGDSIFNGYDNFLKDLLNKYPLVKLSDSSSFRLGENIAFSSGAVVYRNHLMELIQYEPKTEKSYVYPVVLIQPWINKYYIFDLSAHNSFVRFLLNQGFTVFITSWKNPDSNMGNITFEDYMFHGARTAIKVAKEICETSKVHAAGYCIGGTLLASVLAWMNKHYNNKEDIPVADWTLFSTLVDFAEPGDLKNFTMESVVDALEYIMKNDGFLDSFYIDLAFRLLNSDHLIWRYVVNNYLYGQNPPRSDVLFWNNDGTRLPKAMCSFFLKEFYIKNSLVRKDHLVLGGYPMNLGCITQPLYNVGAFQDHISPWKETYKTCHLVGGPARYVLASEGHIAGIINPPLQRSKKKYKAGNCKLTDNPDWWYSSTEDIPGSWWIDWVGWMAERCPNTKRRTGVGSDQYSPLTIAPGNYVFER